ncbi:hypothetical protein GZ172_10095, partial [Dermatophilus congolensis]
LRPDHIAATSDWPGGTFAYYDAPPYRPEFITANENYGSDPDPYLAYIRELQKSIDGPLVLGGLGVSSCIGSGFPGSAGRSQGYHNEKHKFEIDSSLVEQLASGALSGAVMSNWHDDWSAATWNTANRAAFIDRTERPIIDHDPLTADQWLGIVALDPRRAGERVVHKAPKAGLQRVLVDHDASWLYFTLEFAGRITSPVEIGFDLLSNGGLRLPGGSGEPIHDVAIRTVPTMSTTYLLIRQVLDPLQIDGLPLLAIPNSAHIGWNMQRILRSTASLAALDKNNDNDNETDQQRRERLAKLRFLDAGDLILGSWNPKDPDFDSRATWHMARPSSDGPAILRYRLPWGLLDMLDAPRRLAFNPTNRDENQVPVKAMTITIESSTPGSPVSFPLPIPSWSAARYTERVKKGAKLLSEVFTNAATPVERLTSPTSTPTPTSKR